MIKYKVINKGQGGIISLDTANATDIGVIQIDAPSPLRELLLSIFNKGLFGLYGRIFKLSGSYFDLRIGMRNFQMEYLYPFIIEDTTDKTIITPAFPAELDAFRDAYIHY